MADAAREADGIALYIRYLEAQTAGNTAAASHLLKASVALGEPMALHAAAMNEPKAEVAVALYAAAADAGFAASAWNLYVHFDDLGEAPEARLWLQRAAALGDQDAIKIVRKQAG